MGYSKKGNNENTYMYYGSRFGYIDNKTDNRSIDSSSTYTYSTDVNGYFIAPTLGVQYYWTPKFSIGLDAALMYSNTEGTSIQESGYSDKQILDTKKTEHNTRTEVTLRYQS